VLLVTLRSVVENPLILHLASKAAAWSGTELLALSGAADGIHGQLQQQQRNGPPIGARTLSD